jgi:hypothetical protein
VLMMAKEFAQKDTGFKRSRSLRKENSQRRLISTYRNLTYRQQQKKLPPEVQRKSATDLFASHLPLEYALSRTDAGNVFKVNEAMESGISAVIGRDERTSAHGPGLQEHKPAKVGQHKGKLRALHEVGLQRLNSRTIQRKFQNPTSEAWVFISLLDHRYRIERDPYSQLMDDSVRYLEIRLRDPFFYSHLVILLRILDNYVRLGPNILHPNPFYYWLLDEIHEVCVQYFGLDAIPNEGHTAHVR